MAVMKTNNGAKASSTQANGNGATLGFETQLWEAADRMRGHMDPAEYKHIALGLIFLKYISDVFEVRRQELEQEEYADPEDRDEYMADNIFWVPKDARWELLQKNAREPNIGKLVDDAMVAIERDNPPLKGVLPKEYAKPSLDKQRLGELIDLFGKISLSDKKTRSHDTLGRVYEYFLSQFAGAEGKKGGEFYTPRSVVRLLVEMIEPYKGRVYDPCCGSSGMFVQSEEFIAQHGGRLSDITIFGQESNHTTWRLAKMNLAIRGIEANLGPYNADTFRHDLHPDLKADFILANPPFNMSYWGADTLQKDVRWQFGMPPANNANYAWVQHILHHLSPSGVAGFVLANGSMSSNTSGEGEIRRKIVEADLVDCMIALPSQLFYGTGIPACLWFLTRNKDGGGRHRDRRGQTLFIDARKTGELVSRVHRELTDADMSRIAGTYHAWRGEDGAGAYADTPGFCKSVGLAEIESHGFVLTPGRYVGAEDVEDDGEDFAEKMARLTAQLEEQFSQSATLVAAIRESFKGLNYGE